MTNEERIAELEKRVEEQAQQIASLSAAVNDLRADTILVDARIDEQQAIASGISAFVDSAKDWVEGLPR